MSMQKTSRAPDSPKTFLRLTLLVLVAGGLFGIVGLFYTSSVIGDATKSATARSRAAVLLSQTELEIRDTIAAANTRIEAYLAGAEFAALPAQDRDAIRGELNRRDTDPGGPQLPDVLIPV